MMQTRSKTIQSKIPIILYNNLLSRKHENKDIRHSYNLRSRDILNKDTKIEHSYNLRSKICIGFCDDCNCTFLPNKKN